MNEESLRRDNRWYVIWNDRRGGFVDGEWNNVVCTLHCRCSEHEVQVTNRMVSSCIHTGVCMLVFVAWMVECLDK